MRFVYSYQTDKGTVRQINQDSLVLKSITCGNRRALLAAVCDGVGGLSRGEQASRRVAERLAGWAERELPVLLLEERTEEVLRRRFYQILQDINRELFFDNQESGNISGTTLSVLLLWEYKYLIGHVGDSRIYACDRKLCQLTEDHSWVAQELAAGRISYSEAKQHPRRNVILRCIGAEETVTPQLREGTISEKTVFILCTDGLWHYVLDEEWMRYFSPEIILRKEDPLEKVTDENNNRESILKNGLFRLFEQVKIRGESDNITGIAVAVF